MKLHSIEEGERRETPCPYCQAGALEYQGEDASDGDTYRCRQCYCWVTHAPLNDGSCGICSSTLNVLGHAPRGCPVRAVRCHAQEVLPLV